MKRSILLILTISGLALALTSRVSRTVASPTSSDIVAGNQEARTGQAHAYKLSITGRDPCQTREANTSLSSDAYLAIVSESIAYGLGPHFKDSPIPCRSRITLTSKHTSHAITALIVLLCKGCPNNRVYLSPPAFEDLRHGHGHGFENATQKFVEVWWLIDLLRNEQSIVDDPGLNTTGITSEVLREQIRAELAVSIQKNSLRRNERCDSSTEMRRMEIVGGDHSHLFEEHPELQASFDLRYKLATVNKLPGSFCNTYQSLICNGDSQCQCIMASAPSSGNGSPIDCMLNIVKEHQSCIVDFFNLLDAEYGIAVPRPINECWLHNLCALTSDGEYCTGLYEEKLAEVIAQDLSVYNSSKHMLRFKLRGRETVAPDCVCMQPNMLRAFATVTVLIIGRLAKFSAANVLEFGAECDPKMEEFKLKSLAQLRAIDGQMNPKLFKDAVFDNLLDEWNSRSRVMDGLKLLAEDSGAGLFCKTYQHLMCNATSAQCDCYSNLEEGLELVWDVDGSNGNCVLRRGSICDPAFWSGRFENFIDAYEGDAEHPVCEQGLYCVDPSTRQLCPRNDSSYPSVPFKDKIFPYLNPWFKNESNFGTLGLGRNEYCVCGDIGELGVGAGESFGTSRPWWVWALLSAFIALLMGATILAILYQRKLVAAKNFLLKLTTSEQRVFLEGDQALLSKFVGDEGIRAQFRPYDKKRHEILKNCVKYYEQIGEGGFGVVVKGSVTKLGVTREVAIKKCDTKDLDSIRAILVELKILQHIGRHENVVEFVGAVTENMPAPQIVLEYCKHGSLSHVLKTNASMYLDQVHNDEVDFSYTGASETEDKLWIISTSNLLRWSVQIANGMVYLSELRKVIHGDLFLKNVLVGRDGLAKINDFGLSRRFALDGKSYVRIDQGIFPVAELLPPEMRAELESKRVSSEMDIWTFGILLWEMFSLGSEPNCTVSADELPRPEYATTVLYSIMNRCWTPKPANRPGFSKLRNMLARLLGPDASNVNARFDFIVKFVPRKSNNC